MNWIDPKPAFFKFRFRSRGRRHGDEGNVEFWGDQEKQLVRYNGEHVMKGIRARRIRIRIGDLWTSPMLHILLTKEDEVIVARCLDFTVSSHGHNEKEALGSLADSIKEYVITAIESQSIDAIFDPAHGKFWRMYYELESKQSLGRLKSSLRKPAGFISCEALKDVAAEISYA